MKRFAIGVMILALPATAAFAAGDAKAGEAIYAKCKSCHGADGTGVKAVAAMMKVEMKPLGGDTEAQIKDAVTKGHGKMKPIAAITGADLDNVAAYCKTLKK